MQGLALCGDSQVWRTKADRPVNGHTPPPNPWSQRGPVILCPRITTQWPLTKTNIAGRRNWPGFPDSNMDQVHNTHVVWLMVCAQSKWVICAADLWRFVGVVSMSVLLHRVSDGLVGMTGGYIPISHSSLHDPKGLHA